MIHEIHDDIEIVTYLTFSASINIKYENVASASINASEYTNLGTLDIQGLIDGNETALINAENIVAQIPFVQILMSMFN